MVYFPAFATFYHVDDLLVAETIIAAHWGTIGEITEHDGSGSSRVVLTDACHDPAIVNAARCMLRRIDHKESGARFLCV